MSMVWGQISCTGCDFVGYLQYRPVTVIYRFADGTEVKAYREMAWCMTCDGIRDVEDRPSSIASLEAELAQLRDLTASRGYRFKRWFSELTGGQASEEEKKMTVIKGRIKLSLRQGSRRRCLRCGSEDTHPLMGFVHHCGGTFRPEPIDLEAPRFTYREEMIYLNEDGRVIDE